MPRRIIPPIERFYGFVNPEGPQSALVADRCWVWTGKSWDANGYALFGIKAGHTVRAARWIYEQEVGPIPPGLTIHHRCEIRACVRSSHLEPLSQRDNNLASDTLARRNSLKTHCPQEHEYTPENTRHTKQGRRVCITCDRARMLRYYHRKKLVR